MAWKVKNLMTRIRVLNLKGGNAVTLQPRGSKDRKGPTDCAILLDGEELAPDVQTARRLRQIELTEVTRPAPVVKGLKADHDDMTKEGE